jgi:hypothetical protein
LQHAKPFVYGASGNDAKLTNIPANRQFERLSGGVRGRSESDILLSFESDFYGG